MTKKATKQFNSIFTAVRTIYSNGNRGFTISLNEYGETEVKEIKKVAIYQNKRYNRLKQYKSIETVEMNDSCFECIFKSIESKLKGYK